MPSDQQLFTTQPYVPEDGRDFLDYMQVVMKSMDKLRSDGRVPDDQGMDVLLDFWRRIIAQVRNDIARAGVSRRPITSSLPMTATEYKRIWGMFDTLYPLLEILEIRGVIDLKRTDSVTRVYDALYEGTLA
ncbi:MAG TPA: hypothetical protein VHB18_06215 [Mycobacteriales bacterium]|jgi:hypothetical protein|nr:hypothetical protein [Mycobacteriales bacterium]